MTKKNRLATKATAAAVGALATVAVADLIQPRHSILRNYPVAGYARFLMEKIRPEIQQYFIERNFDGEPFDRNTRTMIYRRAKGKDDHVAFGTERDLTAVGYESLVQSLAPLTPTDDDLRITVGGPDCTQPYSASRFNISAMSFGALSARAVLAMNKGAAAGGFLHDTGEGGLTRYHLTYGADLVWELGSGYYSTRTPDGRLDRAIFATTAARPEVKMIEIKLSQGAKPGIGGMLPKEKITEEVSEVPASRGTGTASPRPHTRSSPHRGSWSALSRSSGSLPAASPSGSNCASATVPSSSASAGPCSRRAPDRTSSPWTAPRAGPARHPWSSRTVSACTCPKG